MRKAIAVVLLALVGCSSANSSSSVDGAEDASSSDAATSDVAVEASRDGGPADASPGADSAVSADGGDAAIDPLAPHPPAGSTMCGHGTIRASDWSMGCMAPSFALDLVPKADGGFGPAPRNCGAFTISGGSWEVWCTATDAYVWARFDQLTNQGTWVDCHNQSLVWIDEGVYESGSGGGNGAHVATYMNGTQIVGTVPGMPQTAVLDVTLATNGGGAKLFVLGALENTCMMGAPGEPTVLGGLSVTWMSH